MDSSLVYYLLPSVILDHFDLVEVKELVDVETKKNLPLHLLR